MSGVWTSSRVDQNIVYFPLSSRDLLSNPAFEGFLRFWTFVIIFQVTDGNPRTCALVTLVLLLILARSMLILLFVGLLVVVLCLLDRCLLVCTQNTHRGGICGGAFDILLLLVSQEHDVEHN